MLNVLLAALARSMKRKPKDEDPHIITLYDHRGSPIRVNGHEVAAAINAELIDGASAIDDRLVYQEGWEWPIDLPGLRAIIAMAHAEPDPDIALLNVVLHRGFHEYRPEDEGE